MNIVVLQYTETECTDCILYTGVPSICECNLDTRIRVCDHSNRCVEESLQRLEEFGCLCPNEMLEPMLINGEEVVVWEASLVDVIHKVVALFTGQWEDCQPSTTCFSLNITEWDTPTMEQWEMTVLVFVQTPSQIGSTQWPFHVVRCVLQYAIKSLVHELLIFSLAFMLMPNVVGILFGKGWILMITSLAQALSLQ